MTKKAIKRGMNYEERKTAEHRGKHIGGPGAEKL